MTRSYVCTSEPVGGMRVVLAGSRADFDHQLHAGAHVLLHLERHHERLPHASPAVCLLLGRDRRRPKEVVVCGAPE